MLRIELGRCSVTYVTDMKETVLMVYLCLARKRHATNAFVQCGRAEKLAMVRYIDQSLREFVDIKCSTTIERKVVLIQQAWFDERDRKDKILIDGPEMELASGITTTTTVSYTHLTLPTNREM